VYRAVLQQLVTADEVSSVAESGVVTSVSEIRRRGGGS
jgi:hypothetical protein